MSTFLNCFWFVAIIALAVWLLLCVWDEVEKWRTRRRFRREMLRAMEQRQRNYYRGVHS